MSSQHAKGLTSNDSGLHVRSRRLTQIIVLALSAMLLSIGQNVLYGNLHSAAILGFASALLLLAIMRNSQGYPEQAGSIVLTTLTLMVAIFLWVDQGLRDPALLAFPGLLIFASMLDNGRVFFVVLLLMVISVLVIGTGNVMGWHQNIVRPVRIGTMVDILGILLVIGGYVWLMSDDRRRALQKLRAENERVRASQAKIEYLAHHDPLTGLPNRLISRDRFDQAMAHAHRHGNKAALLYLDLDNFKSINDSLGHVSGDELLRDVAARLQGEITESDTVCRLGGDEFLIVMGELDSGDDAGELAVRILKSLSRPITGNRMEISATCSIGVAIYPDDGGDFDSLLQRADMAMYEAKGAGRNAFRFFDMTMNTSVLEHMHMVSGIRLALQMHEFVLHYQPQLDLVSGNIVGAEALIRWRHPALGLIPPAKFIPVAERSGLIIEVGAWVIHEACQQLTEWRRRGLKDLLISVNLSPIQFKRDDVERVVTNALFSSGLPPGCLELELTESLLIEESDKMSAMLKRLRSQGVRFSIDDFGTGYSNLGYLKRFEVECLKIDQSFIRRLNEDMHDEAIVTAIVQMSQSLKLTTVAEGIEDQATLERLIEIGCDRGQGFYWAPALDPEAFYQFSRSRMTSALTHQTREGSP